MSAKILKDFDEWLLLAIQAANGQAYGVTLKKTIESKTGRPTSYGAIYTALDRMEVEGFISSRMGEATAERGGRAKKLFRLEGAGQLALSESEAARRALATPVPMLGGHRLIGGSA